MNSLKYKKNIFFFATFIYLAFAICVFNFCYLYFFQDFTVSSFNSAMVCPFEI